MNPDALFYQGLVGLTNAMYLWLVAAGLTIAFGVLKIINFAHGSLYMIGAYLAFSLYGQMGLGFGLSLLLATVSVGLLGLALERLLFRPLYNLDITYGLILTFGLVLVSADLVRIVWGGVFLIPPTPDALIGSFRVFGRAFSYYNTFVIVAGLAVGAGLWLLLDRTWWGRTVRATASDREMAGALGVNVGWVYASVFVLAAGVAALGGALSIPVRVVTPGLGTTLIIEAFIITVIGGLGSLRGAFLGAIIVGLANAYGVLLFPDVALFLIYGIMALVLLVKPEGLLAGAR
ncbi:MAG: branched-chain amino acid ABC transporter permease [Nitriliruptorales bacterium]|nr:branched-chain amino acid ABC transporter permease [Nitriliruptorales bacterium]